MKSFILTCVNESMNIISNDAFPTYKAAEKEMKRQYRNESRKGDKDAPPLYDKSITPTTAFVNRGDDCMYSWEINELQIHPAATGRHRFPKLYSEVSKAIKDYETKSKSGFTPSSADALYEALNKVKDNWRQLTARK